MRHVLAGPSGYWTVPPRSACAGGRTGGAWCRAARECAPRAARRPTLAAWAANLLLRSRPEESAKLLELGRALREAREELRRADEDRDRAEYRHRAAAHALDQAERQATEADRALRRPRTAPTGPWVVPVKGGGVRDVRPRSG
jgi:hypothetical protein